MLFARLRGATGWSSPVHRVGQVSGASSRGRTAAMPHTRLVASAFACVICVGGRAYAQDTGQAAVNACRPAVTKKLQSAITQAKSVEFVSEAPALISNTETSVTG